MTRASRPRWRARERAIRLEPTAEYLALKARLTSEARRYVELAEEGIAVDTEHRFRRYERADGTLVDWNEPGILLTFRILDPDVVQLIDLDVLF